ncbi:hypothetical protein LOY35_16705 [Pseudomonas sp. B21-028]|uniref:hypothetical protein n=1 Tax=Pseudomonas sp. B21-028 TaxID=2895480 RepID=UPI00215E15FB|nr:hypothetical protein [Pseudomonas sp. B21-028]UVL81869.1 hypothetical protein LOY35_16705 [Pseudomonas sp. B21-028]
MISVRAAVVQNLKSVTAFKKIPPAYTRRILKDFQTTGVCMTKLKTYAALVDDIFGPGTATFKTESTTSNDVVGAIASTTDFEVFRKNFEERLRRLQGAIQLNQKISFPIINAVNGVAKLGGWEGYYAELVALDYFLSDAETGPGEIELDVTVPALDAIASEFKMQNINYDLCIPSLGIVTDVKILSDKSGGILDGIFKEFRSVKGITHLTIQPEYSEDEDYDVFQGHRSSLLKELIEEIDTTARPPYFRSKVIEGLSYRFAWEAGVVIAESSYDSKTHASNHQRLLVTHAKKFSRREPTIIIFVVFPWASERIMLFSEMRIAQEFIHNLGSIFFDITGPSTVEARSINKNIKTSISLADVSRHLSGILLIEDKSILASDDDLIADASYIFNENAVHTLNGSKLESYLKRRNATNLINFLKT